MSLRPSCSKADFCANALRACDSGLHRPLVMVQPVGVWILGCEGFDSIVIPRDMVHRILLPVMPHSFSIYCAVVRIARYVTA